MTADYPQDLIDDIASTLDAWDGKPHRRVVDDVTHFDLHAIAILDTVRDYLIKSESLSDEAKQEIAALIGTKTP